MRPSMTARWPGTGLLYLITSSLLWGTGGLTGSLLSRVAGLSAMSVAACRLTAGGVLIVIFLTVTGRRWPAGRAAWARIAVIGVLAALYQSCYFTAVALTSVALATLVTIGTAPVIVLGVYQVTGHRAGRLAPVAACLALVGLGVGLFQVPNLAQMMAAFPAVRQGVAGGLGFLSRTLGSAVGVLRIAGGGHFFTDVVFAGVFMYLVIWAAYGLIYRWRPKRADGKTDNPAE